VSEYHSLGDFKAAFYKTLAADADAPALWEEKGADWRRLVAESLAQGGRTEFPGLRVSERGQGDNDNLADDLAIEVVGTLEPGWAPPVVIADHEPSLQRDQLQRRAWKLLSIEARRRVLVCYWADAPGRPRGSVRSLPEVEVLVKEVARALPRRDLYVLAAPFAGKARKRAEVPKLFHSYIVGVW